MVAGSNPAGRANFLFFARPPEVFMLEICIDTLAGIDAAIEGGADRLELCAALAVGGLTPPLSLVTRAAAAPIPSHLLCRPRDGDFCYGPAEAAMVADDIRLAAEAGLAGVVIGASAADYRLDAELLASWVAHARAEGAKAGRTLSLTLHRAFDLVPDPLEALETAIALGFDRILTSGCAPRAADALDTLAALARQAEGRIRILAGSGIDATNARAILATGVPEIHASCRSPGGTPGEAEQRFGFQTGPGLHTDPEKVAALRRILADYRTLNSTNI
ncbi:copper homeostasis protein CutC [Sphingomonas sp. NIBR02145]|uniref:copper homeostasis protein CutC n=1 Tax=Sphingomonas sp. NIBR02145 TaxID=3014784 RepID=UPI0022B2CF60|nr:copper homeostasis protein CutC [Sphingomonas sp. NIBR02145]WHU04135.1 copper homeostasis protein CutC [Sphingomonas sp. NIBR02145]